MSQNKPKLNADKTKILVMGNPHMRANISIPSISINGVIVPVRNEPRGHLVALDVCACIQSYQVCTLSCQKHWKISKFLNFDTTKSAVVSRVTSRL